MKFSTRTKLWLLWLGFSLTAIFILLYMMLSNNTDKTIFMPGPLSDGHHQLADACQSCHVDAFGGGEVLQQSCINCHGDIRVKPFDSHPKAKFTDPRNADLLEKINAQQCVTCHSEHKIEITQKDGLTQPVDFCVHCHSEIDKERESHKDMPFDSCKDSGCHNFHDNRAIYTKYLIKHLGEPELLKSRFMPEREFASVLYELPGYPMQKYPVQPLTIENIDVAGALGRNKTINHQWAQSKHARSGVNCTACHTDDNLPEQSNWINQPNYTACKSCHDNEVERFQLGKHGMRLSQELSPMIPAHARLPMRKESSHTALTCHSCHDAHEYNIHQAAVDSCLSCHDDEHSNAYKSSKHYQLWQNEISGEAEENTGISCASCHMPRVNYDVSEWMSRTIVDHNQSANLSPNSKMIRSTCQNCHGLEFSINAMTDATLVKNNFNGKPAIKVKSMDLAEQERQRQQKESAEDDDAEMFGF